MKADEQSTLSKVTYQNKLHKENKEMNQFKKRNPNRNPRVTFHPKTVAHPRLPFKTKNRTPFLFTLSFFFFYTPTLLNLLTILNPPENQQNELFTLLFVKQTPTPLACFFWLLIAKERSKVTSSWDKTPQWRNGLIDMHQDCETLLTAKKDRSSGFLGSRHTILDVHVSWNETAASLEAFLL